MPKKGIFRSYKEAREFAHTLKLKKVQEWQKWATTEERPKDIPSNPAEYYKSEWQGWTDFLGTENISGIIKNRSYRSFQAARKFARNLGLKTNKEWQKWAKTNAKPSDIPLAPHLSYKKNWQGWGDFLGTGFVATKYRVYKPFEEARNYVRSLKIKTKEDLDKWLKSPDRPIDIPLTPNVVYAKEWLGFGDFLGTGNIANFDREYRTFKEARQYVSTLELKSKDEWTEYAKTDQKPKDIPASPRNVYKDEWQGWPYFLNNGVISTRNRQWRSFEQAKKFAQSLSLKNNQEWREWSKTKEKPLDIPSYPNEVYEENWISWGVFLGTGAISVRDRTYRSFEEAKNYVHGLGLKTHLEWIEYAKPMKNQKIFHLLLKEYIKTNGVDGETG